MRGRRITSVAVLAAFAAVATTQPAQAKVTHYPYEVSGTEVTAQKGESGGPKLAPGRYRTTLPGNGEEHSFTVDRKALGLFTVAVVSPITGESFEVGEDHDLEVELTAGADAASCDKATDDVSEGNAPTFLRTIVGIDDSPNTKRQYPLYGDCKDATTMNLVLKREGGGNAVPVEIRVVSEPRAEGGASTVDKSDLEELVPRDGETHAEAAGGRGFATATTLEPGTTPTKLTYGGYSFFRVRLDWNQRLAADLTVPQKGTNFAPPAAVDFRVSVWAPNGKNITQNYSQKVRSNATLSANSAEQQTAGVFTAPVQTANFTHESFSGGLGRDQVPYTTSPGWYTLAVYTGPTNYSNDEIPDEMPQIPASLRVDVVGDPGQAPKLVDSSGTAVQQPPAHEMSLGEGESSGEGLPWLKIGLSLGVLAVAALAVLWAWLRGKRAKGAGQGATRQQTRRMGDHQGTRRMPDQQGTRQMDQGRSDLPDDATRRMEDQHTQESRRTQD